MSFCRSSPNLHVSNLSSPASTLGCQEPVESLFDKVCSLQLAYQLTMSEIQLNRGKDRHSPSAERRGFVRRACFADGSICFNLACTQNGTERQVLRTVVIINSGVKMPAFHAILLGKCLGAVQLKVISCEPLSSLMTSSRVFQGMRRAPVLRTFLACPFKALRTSGHPWIEACKSHGGQRRTTRDHNHWTVGTPSLGQDAPRNKLGRRPKAIIRSAVSADL